MSMEEQIRAYIVENSFLEEDERLDSAQSLLESGVVDSTGVIELVAFLEEAFSLKIEDAELVPENLDTIENMVNFVKRKLRDAPLQDAASPSRAGCSAEPG